jgi:hypothetical protein
VDFIDFSSDADFRQAAEACGNRENRGFYNGFVHPGVEASPQSDERLAASAHIYLSRTTLSNGQ